MTVDEAIQHCYDVANKLCDECGEEHLQLAKWLEELKRIKQENAELKRLLKLAAKELTPDICDYCIYNGSKHCEEENAELECGNMACQFAYWRHYDEVKGLISDE